MNEPILHNMYKQLSLNGNNSETIILTFKLLCDKLDLYEKRLIKLYQENNIPKHQKENE